MTINLLTITGKLDTAASILKIIHFAVLPSGVVYIILSLLLLKEHRRKISNQLSYVERINLSWLSKLTIGICVIWLSVLFGNDITTFTSIDLFILFIGYFGVKQVGIFTNKMEDQQHHHKEITAPVKYQRSAVGEVLLSEIHVELLNLMDKKSFLKIRS